jgi:hypothetical protein
LLYYDAVEATVHNFLVANPSETVFVSVFPRDDSNFNKKNFLDHSFNGTNSEYYYHQDVGIPTLNECKSKIVMVYRFDLQLSDGSSLQPFGIDTSS